MKLIIDENIPQGKEAFGSFGEIVLAAGREIDNKLLKDADILIIRSITQVNENLLKETNIKFVGTATIGTDHVDKKYLRENNIEFADAAGCNAFSVAEYVLCAINQFLVVKNKKFEELSIGVIGCGNVGSKVAKFACVLGMNVLINDPPLSRISGKKDFCSLDEALSADVVTFHVPLNKTGEDKTIHLLDEKNLSKIKSGSILINSSRGAVVDNNSLLKRLKTENDLFTVLDVWENEPKIIDGLLEHVNIGTPHIAGYSYEGKINGTTIIFNKLKEFLKTTNNWAAALPLIGKNTFEFDTSNSFEHEFNELTKNIYDIYQDNVALKNSLTMSDEFRPKYFDELRKKYPVRREFNNYSVKLSRNDLNTLKKMQELRFQSMIQKIE